MVKWPGPALFGFERNEQMRPRCIFRGRWSGMIELLLAFVICFVISVLCLFVVVKVLGSSNADFKTVAAAAALMTVVGTVLIFIPIIGWIAAFIINIIIVKSIMECSTLMAFLAVILWGVLSNFVAGSFGVGLGLF